MFAEDYKLWRRRAAGDKNWQQFKTYFIMDHQELRESQKTLQGAGYHATNNTFVQTSDDSDLKQETADAIANLATATAADRATVATLIHTNSKLTQELIIINPKLVIALETNKRLTAKIGSSSTKQKKKGPYYCYTCGYGQWHSSNRCITKGSHHKDEAIKDNKIKGSTATFKIDQ